MSRIAAAMGLACLMFGCGGKEELDLASTQSAVYMPILAPSVCGNGKRELDNNELCDGSDLGGKTCQSFGYAAGTLKCSPYCRFDTSGCYKCGDGKRSGAEQCDGSDLAGKSCPALGFAGGALACTPGCTFNTTNCYRCGDGKKNGTEACDGPDLGGASCVSLGFKGGSLGCYGSCAYNTSGCYKCGDGKKNGTDQCDGYDFGGLSCATHGYGGGGLTCRPDCTIDSSTCQDTQGHIFATACTNTYEIDPVSGDPWCDEYHWSSWNMCQLFTTQMAKTDRTGFTWDLVNKEDYFHEAKDEAAVETVDLLYVNTHGGVDSTDCTWCPSTGYSAHFMMWNHDSSAKTRHMRLGDEQRGLSILASYACKTLKNDDGLLPARWGKAVQGGLRMVLGSYDTFNSWSTTEECGEDFALELQANQTIRDAWRNGMGDWLLDNDIAVMSTGRDFWECLSRLGGMTWSNFMTYPRLRGNDVQWYCWTTWQA